MLCVAVRRSFFTAQTYTRIEERSYTNRAQAERHSPTCAQNNVRVMFDFKSYTDNLWSLFSAPAEHTVGARTDIYRFRFEQSLGADRIAQLQADLPTFDYASARDEQVAENRGFTYNIFVPHGCSEPFDRATILLHGLNERSWGKYLTWADSLAYQTRRPVILFPLAFHMNRTPAEWYNPRRTLLWHKLRSSANPDNTEASFANVTLSARISEDPRRFYTSGIESCYNLSQLLAQIERGDHPLFRASTHCDLFGYSIGAMAAQVMMLANPDGLLDESRLFIFMGGSSFNKMNGLAKNILDGSSFEALHRYYGNDFINSAPSTGAGSEFDRAFRLLLRPDHLRTEREAALTALGDRVHIITMRHDKVMTTEGATCLYPTNLAGEIIEERDFPFEYSHQAPFPSGPQSNNPDVARSFTSIFDTAAEFLLA